MSDLLVGNVRKFAHMGASSCQAASQDIVSGSGYAAVLSDDRHAYTQRG